MSFRIREAEQGDLYSLLKLYTYLNENEMPVVDGRVRSVFADILSNPCQTLLVCSCGEEVISALTVSVIPSLTHGQRPYALIEHVVTHPDFRRRGCARALLARAAETAFAADCYKLMLVTGQADECVHRLYRSCGFSAEGKTAYVKELVCRK